MTPNTSSWPMATQTVDERCDEWSEKGIALCRFIMNARNESVLALRLRCSGPHVAEAANRIIAERTREQQELDDAPRLNWYAGDVLEVYAHASEFGKGLSYPAMTVTASEDGFAGGWDVWDATAADGSEVSFYGFSVKSAQIRQSYAAMQKVTP